MWQKHGNRERIVLLELGLGVRRAPIPLSHRAKYWGAPEDFYQHTSKAFERLRK